MSRKLEGRYEQRHNRVAADTRNRACKSDQTESRDLVTQDVQQLSAENEILKKRCVAAQNELLRLKRQYQDLERDYRKLKRDLHSTSSELKHIHDSDFYHWHSNTIKSAIACFLRTVGCKEAQNQSFGC